MLPAHLFTLNRNTQNWHTKVVTLSETKGLSERFFAEPVLSVVEGLRMTRPRDRSVKCTNVMWSDLKVSRPSSPPLLSAVVSALILLVE